MSIQNLQTLQEYPRGLSLPELDLRDASGLIANKLGKEFKPFLARTTRLGDGFPSHEIYSAILSALFSR